MKKHKIKQMCALICTASLFFTEICGCTNAENTNKNTETVNNNIELTIMGTSDIHNYIVQ